MSDATAQQKIACTLDDQERRDRRKLVRKTIVPRMLKGELTDSGLRASFPNEARESVDEFVSLERDCCSFLTFSFQASDQDFTLTIEAPVEAKETLLMFAKGLGLSQ